jgi:hypothetical protein
VYGPPPQAIKAATADWRGGEDTVGEFIRSCLILDPRKQIMTSELLDAFNEFNGGNGTMKVKGLLDKVRNHPTLLNQQIDTMVNDYVRNYSRPTNRNHFLAPDSR